MIGSLCDLLTVWECAVGLASPYNGWDLLVGGCLLERHNLLYIH
jgi:hypothetical protein